MHTLYSVTAAVEVVRAQLQDPMSWHTTHHGCSLQLLAVSQATDCWPWKHSSLSSVHATHICEVHIHNKAKQQSCRLPLPQPWLQAACYNVTLTYHSTECPYSCRNRCGSAAVCTVHQHASPTNYKSWETGMINHQLRKLL